MLFGERICLAFLLQTVSARYEKKSGIDIVTVIDIGNSFVSYTFGYHRHIDIHTYILIIDKVMIEYSTDMAGLTFSGSQRVEYLFKTGHCMYVWVYSRVIDTIERHKTVVTVVVASF